MRREKLTKSIAEELKNVDNDDAYLEMEVETTCVLYELAIIIQN
jgi:hypothetical protein